MKCGGYFDTDNKLIKIKELEEKMSSATFWDNQEIANNVINELNNLKKIVNLIKTLKNKIDANLELLSYDDIEVKELIVSEIDEIKKELDDLEIFVLLNGPYDKNDAVLEIHPGAGGTESCDWANMLFRMYTRWCEEKNFKYEIVELQKGEEAGIKSVTIIIKGTYAYGYLKCEKGVHRLVRISPFDSNSRRHTSFASVDVSPYFQEENIDIQISPNDLKIDVYHSSGAGGQSVNTTDSAVRITHLPTKIVVTCQNERSQLQNKEKALEILKSKLYKIELDKRDMELKQIKGEQTDINFGSQIRSYVLHPYTMVKDHRTNTQNNNAQKVLDGDIDMFINDNLRMCKNEK